MLLFKPYRLKGLNIKNRLVMFPMGTQFGSVDGDITERLLEYYSRRAEGGVGLIEVENTYVELTGKLQKHMLSLSEDKYILGFAKLADAVHKSGAKILVQTGHAGREASTEITGLPVIAPSPIASPMKRLSDNTKGELPKELSTEEIGMLIERHGEFARRAKTAGFDGVELLCAHRCLPEQFLFSDSNQRHDEYGGSIENRTRFISDVIKEFRKQTGEDFIISCRVPITEYPEGGYGNEEIKFLVTLMEKIGVDLLSLTVASSRQWVNLQPMAFPRGSLLSLSQWIKEFINIPVICGIRINDPRLAETALCEKKADLIGMGRPLICDPELPRKTLEGRYDDIRMCIACNKCSEKTYAHSPITCALNVEVGREKELQIKPAITRKKVLIIGGGPAGLEVARVAALRGHKVLLCEKRRELGGQLLLASIPPYKEEICNVIRFLESQVKKLGVKVELGKEVDLKYVREQSPDVIVFATGASPIVPNIPGVDGCNVNLFTDILLGKEVGQKVVIIGGGQAGLETAEYLIQRGKAVVVIEMSDRIARDLEPISRMFMKHRLIEKGLKILTGTKALQINTNGVIALENDKTIFVAAESVVLAVGVKPNVELVKCFENEYATFSVGDCHVPGGILEAIHSASILARQI